ncbi:bifunctional metallophosphatase/5'-nucleotidase [Croceibacterium soli]|uniref:bifunctional metallophosphatase/5'-nucleotidase n=1 Tax=Croceibacterium soli TaxID=1739690 RepID=UPI00136CFF3F|nr:bifunctional metallophosphatase/5'-nucleotidase [Croceibacterium soli]
MEPLAPAAPVAVQILALNDFHGTIEAPTGAVAYATPSGMEQAPLGGAARLAATLARLREGQSHTVTVAAGDLIGASPLASAYFLDEPAIAALSAMGLDIAAVGNHEFDRGTAELRRVQEGGCEAHTARQPCALEPFAGAGFDYLAGNVLDEEGRSFFPGTAVHDFGGARIGFIGLTLKETAELVSPAGTAGYRFADEAGTANALAAELRAAGADAVVLLIHQGGSVEPYFNLAACPGLSGDILPILDRLDPAIGLVVSGHTHAAYVCELDAADGSKRLLTSAGRYGSFVTRIAMTVDPQRDRVVSLKAENVPVRAEAGEDPAVAAIVERYVGATAPIAARVAGRIEGSLEAPGGGLDTPVGNLIADAQLAATRGPQAGRAEISFINSGGVRTRFQPGADGSVTYGQLFALQPFGNTLVVLEMTGREIGQLLEQQFTGSQPAEIRQSLLIPSEGFSFAFDRTRAPGERIVAMTLHGQAIEPERRYRVTVNNFLASGGDGFTVFAEARPVAEGGADIDALEAYIAGGVTAPAGGRVSEVTIDGAD